MKSFSVSVVIPVYNCESFILKSIESALLQPEVSEIVVVNDGSTDNTQSILEKLQKQNSIIKIFYHKNKSNKGRSATRNLGIKMATNRHIAFLDADDYYLPSRFGLDKRIFEGNKACDGVYNAIGVHFYRKTNKLEEEKLKLTTINRRIEPEALYEALLFGKNGHFSIDGLTVKKIVFEKAGYFNEDLKVAEDTQMFFKMALKCNLYAGNIEEPLAMRGIHDNNVANNEMLYKKYRFKMYESLFLWTANKNIKKRHVDGMLKIIWLMRFKQEKSLLKNIIYWCYLFFNNTTYLYSIFSIKYFPVIRLRKKLFPFLYKIDKQ